MSSGVILWNGKVEKMTENNQNNQVVGFYEAVGSAMSGGAEPEARAMSVSDDNVGSANISSGNIEKFRRNMNLNTLFDHAVGDIDALRKAIRQTGPLSLTALVSVYRIHVALQNDVVSREDFLGKLGVKQDPRAKYPAQPLIRHLVTKAAPELRSMTSHWAGAIAWAERNNVDPENFEDFIKGIDGGIRGAYAAEVKATRSPNERKKRADRINRAKTVYFKTVDPVAVLSMSCFQNIGSGMHLAFVKVEKDGSIKLVDRWDKDVSWVESAFDRHVVSATENRTT